MWGRITGVMALTRRHDAQFAARLAALIADRYDAQARVPAGRHGGGQFTSSGGGGGGPSKAKERRAAARSFTNASVERAIKSGATEKQVRAIREIEHRAHLKVQRASARLAQGTQQTLFTKAPKQPGAYRLAKAVGGGTAVGIANKALVHAAAQKGLAEHAARVAGRKSTPPPAAAPHAGTTAAASLRPAAAAPTGRTGHERKADWEVDQALSKSHRDMREAQIPGTLSHRNRAEVTAHHESLLAEQAKRAPERARKEAIDAERVRKVEAENAAHEAKQNAEKQAATAADEARAARERAGEGDTLGRIMAEAKARPASLGSYEDEVEKSKARAQSVAARETAQPIKRALTQEEKERARKLEDAIDVLASSERQHQQSQSEGGRDAAAKVVRAARSRVENLHLGLEPGVYAKHAAQQERSAKAKATKAAKAKAGSESGYHKQWRASSSQDAWNRARK